MNYRIDESTFELARTERAPNRLGAKIVAKSRRRRWTRRAVLTGSLAASLGLATLLTPRPAYANMEESIALSEKQPVVVIKSWRFMQGQKTPPSTRWIGKGIVREKNGFLDWSDDGKTMVQYWPSMHHLYTDASHPSSFRNQSLRDQASGLKAWASARRWGKIQQDLNATYHGAPATKLSLHGTYRDAGRDNSIEVTVITEPNNGRVLYTETWRDNRSWADFTEYSYPDEESQPFKVEAPAGTPTTDMRDVRKELSAKARAARPSGGDPAFVAAYRDAGGSIWVVTKGGALPDPAKPQNIYIDGKQIGSGDTYAFLLGGQSPFPTLGKDVYLQTAGTQERENQIPASGDIEVWSWKIENGKSLPDRKVKYAGVKILQIPVIALLRPMLLSPQKDLRKIIRPGG